MLRRKKGEKGGAESRKIIFAMGARGVKITNVLPIVGQSFFPISGVLPQAPTMKPSNLLHAHLIWNATTVGNARAHARFEY